MRVGVLALQGAFAKHIEALAELGHDAVEVRTASELVGIDGLVLPGGESSAMWRLMQDADLRDAVEAWRRGPVLATCAGLILIAARVTDPAQPTLGWLDVDVQRNSYGRQLDSFEASSDGKDAQPLVFIRAPRITRVGPGVEILAQHRGEPVLVRRGSILAATFHPELTSDRRVHALAFGGLDDDVARRHGELATACTAPAATVSSPTTTPSARATGSARSSVPRSTTSG
jgi:pyridoxal 5'-phosphate synthase pdxT subunit